MFPIRDDNPTLRTPVVTIGIIIANCVGWLLLQGAGTDAALASSVCEYGLIPGELTQTATEPAIRLGEHALCQLEARPQWFTLVSSMFMHGGWLHLIGNMWFLWIFGNNVEDSMGRGRFVAFYLLCGLAAAGAQIAASPSSSVPMVGASGAIGGVMGAYIVLYPRVAVTLLIVLGFFITSVRVPAYFMLGYWLLLQLIGGLPQLGEVGGGTAFWAHVGGFAGGALLIGLFKDPALVEEHRRLLRRL